MTSCGCSGDAGPGPDVEIVPQHQLATRGDGKWTRRGTLSAAPQMWGIVTRCSRNSVSGVLHPHSTGESRGVETNTSPGLLHAE